MRKIITAVVLSSTMTMSAMAAAQVNVVPPNFSNTWVEAKFVDYDSNADGFLFEGSYGLDKNLNVIGSLELGDTNGADYSILTGGASYALGLGNLSNLDLLIHAELGFGQVDVGAGDDSDVGVIFGGELRFTPIEVIEVYGDLYYGTVWNSDLGLEIGGRFYATKELVLSLGLEIADNDALYLGARFNF